MKAVAIQSLDGGGRRCRRRRRKKPPPRFLSPFLPPTSSSWAQVTVTHGQCTAVARSGYLEEEFAYCPGFPLAVPLHRPDYRVIVSNLGFSECNSEKHSGLFSWKGRRTRIILIRRRGRRRSLHLISRLLFCSFVMPPRYIWFISKNFFVVHKISGIWKNNATPGKWNSMERARS